MPDETKRHYFEVWEPRKQNCRWLAHGEELRMVPRGFKQAMVEILSDKESRYATGGVGAVRVALPDQDATLLTKHDREILVKLLGEGDGQ